MPETYRRKYGLDWGLHTSDTQIELLCAKKWREPLYQAGKLTDPADHLLRACRLIFPQDDPACPFRIHAWTEEHAYDWTHETFCITWGCAASGKAQPMDAIVFTPAGPRTMGSIAPGDHVMAHDGTPARVAKVTDVGMKQVFRVSFLDGTSTLCAGDHLWEVSCTDPNVWSGLPRVLTAEQISALSPSRHYCVPLCRPVEFAATPVFVDPYILGALLGDGSFGGRSGTGVIRFSSADDDIVTEFRRGLAPGYELTRIPKMTQDYCLVRSGSRGRMPNRYIRELKAYGLWGKLSYEKHVPSCYLYNSVEVRRRVLSGLLDTDGTCSKRGDVSFTSTSKQLALDVQSLVQSLGGYASITVSPSHHTKDGVRVAARDAYLVSIALPGAASYFCLRRKRDRAARLPARKYFKKYIARVEKLDACAPMRCITLDSGTHPRGLYLTNDFIVTHNSNDFGLFVYLDWAVDPFDTYTVMASTTKDMLKLRTYESVIRYFTLLKARDEGWPGVLAKTETSILCAPEGDKAASAKAAIKGVAVREGSVEEARANLQGVHLPYVREVADELSQMREAVMEARFNLRQGAKDFRFFGLANPDSIYDLAGQYSTPLGGWGTVDENTREWRTKWGKVRHHNGYQSPAILEPGGAEKYPFLINAKSIDETIQDAGGDADHPQIWTMVRGFPPPQGLERTVLTETAVKTFKMSEDGVVWDRIIARIAGLDPAFTSGGDGCILQFAELGVLAEGITAVRFTATERLTIQASSPRPVVYQIVDQLRDLLNRYGVQVQDLGIDDSGTQSVADVVDVEIGTGAYRTHFNAKASELPLSASGVKACDRVADQITELYYLMSEFGQRWQIRALPPEAAKQFCIRRIDPKKRPLRLEPKTEVKKRLRKSPDEADACAVTLAVARYRFGLSPGVSKTEPRGTVLRAPAGLLDKLRRINNMRTKYA